MKIFNLSIFKLTFCLIIGIIIGYVLDVTVLPSVSLTITFFTLLTLSFIMARNQFIKTLWFGLFAFLTMMSLGILTTSIHDQKHFSKHYTHQVLNAEDSINTISFRIREVLKSGNYYDKYVIDLLKVNDEDVNGKILLNVEKDSLKPALNVDDIRITRTVFKNLIPPLNPNQFDYKSYLRKQYIYHQLFVKNQSLLNVSSETHTIFGLADNIRSFINSKLKSYNFKPDELAIINALFLGQRQDLSKEIYASYTNAGAIHILAVSGLHVGIILIILNFMLKPFERLKKGLFIKTVVLLILLWSFAIIAGLSASVTRAVTMFSIVAIAMNLKRPTNIYNTLVISMFFILLCRPLFIFDVGFQLSYLAVFSIVAIDPLLYKLWQPKNWILDTYWHTLTVTISAQFGIIPISLYYFHQFPSLFFVSNLVIIPLLGLILGLGIVVILSASIDLLPQFIADAFSAIIRLMNWFVNWIAKHEAFLFKDISFSLLYVVASYIFIISIFRLLLKRHYSTLKFLLISVLILQVALLYTNYNTPENQFIIFHKSRNSLIGNVTKNKIVIAHDMDSITFLKNKIIKDYSVGNHIHTIENASLKNLYILNTKVLLVVDNLGVYNIKSTKPDYVYLRQSPKINLNRLIDSISPKQIIADGSNYKSYLKHWELICKKRKLPFHHTSKKGAFIIRY
ncbi:ComEC/Rec2 family competence protein [Seonamhaeicola marinus]|uniref:ComEC family competence protein n=1 Tax=Seonamhaeicola marinus TaxID=1912246 RepID=A0A5D0J9U8_9FLAO|nr:ComEC/Rec2 family competence protein [Seonamhaeicola marinus]TYA92346.1 ComEC family competence protein [Seonamhaeicola marinus]